MSKYSKSDLLSYVRIKTVDHNPLYITQVNHSDMSFKRANNQREIDIHYCTESVLHLGYTHYVNNSYISMLCHAAFCGHLKIMAA
jgi:hypothetical protein